MTMTMTMMTTTKITKMTVTLLQRLQGLRRKEGNHHLQKGKKKKTSPPDQYFSLSLRVSHARLRCPTSECDRHVSMNPLSHDYNDAHDVVMRLRECTFEMSRLGHMVISLIASSVH